MLRKLTVNPELCSYQNYLSRKRIQYKYFQRNNKWVYHQGALIKRMAETCFKRKRTIPELSILGLFY